MGHLSDFASLVVWMLLPEAIVATLVGLCAWIRSQREFGAYWRERQALITQRRARLARDEADSIDWVRKHMPHIARKRGY